VEYPASWSEQGCVLKRKFIVVLVHFHAEHAGTGIEGGKMGDSKTDVGTQIQYATVLLQRDVGQMKLLMEGAPQDARISSACPTKHTMIA
jgi:hypothetical protein